MNEEGTNGNAAGRTVVNTRLMDASQEMLFDAVADPERLVRWWGPKGFTNTFEEFDFRPGGLWNLTMQAPDGSLYPNESQFTEMERPERIVFEHLRPMHWYRMEMTFAPEGEKTRITWQMTFDSDEEYARVGQYVKAANEENFDRLEEELSGMTADTRTTSQ